MGNRASDRKVTSVSAASSSNTTGSTSEDAARSATSGAIVSPQATKPAAATSRRRTPITAAATKRTAAGRPSEVARAEAKPRATKDTKPAAAAPRRPSPGAAKRTSGTKKRTSGTKKRTGGTKKRTSGTKKRTAAGTLSVSRAARKHSASGAALPLSPRRAIYIDVENTSSQAALLEVIDSLKIDRTRESAELVAVGNWRAVGQQVGRDLAALGAQLVHSAPARGVRDWSDLWIAVAAGGWIARARPGDILEIVSNDRAFDAVADAAAAHGVIYHRLEHRRSGAVAHPVTDSGDGEGQARPRRRTRRSRRSRPAAAAAPAMATSAASVRPAPAATAADGDEPHGASREQMVDLVRRLAQGRPSPWVNLDVLESALKREGYSRPPGSPRLVTRLRRLKDFEIDSHGRVRVVEADSTQ